MPLLSYFVRRAGSSSDDAPAGAAANGDVSPDEHLDDAPDGCGCAEVWEHLSEQREAGEA